MRPDFVSNLIELQSLWTWEQNVAICLKLKECLIQYFFDQLNSFEQFRMKTLHVEAFQKRQIDLKMASESESVQIDHFERWNQAFHICQSLSNF